MKPINKMSKTKLEQELESIDQWKETTGDTSSSTFKRIREIENAINNKQH